MATIPLPALHTAPIEQPPNQLQQMAQIMGLKNQQAMQPLQQQAAQQQVQLGAADVALKQQQVKDQQTISSLSPNFVQKDQSGKVTGYDYNGLFNAAAQAGASPQTLFTLQKGISDATLARANASKAQLENQQTLNSEAFAHLEGIRGTQDPEERQQLWGSALQWTAQHAQDLGVDPGKLPAQPPDDRGLNGIEAMLGMHAQQIKDAASQAGINKDVAATGEAQATTQQKQAETAWYAKNGGAPGVPVDAQQQASWLAAHPTQTPADYAIMMKKLVPALQFNLNQQAANGSSNSPQYQLPGGAGTDWGRLAAQRYGMTPAAFDQQAEQAGLGKFPPIGRNANAIAMNRDLMNRYAELHPDASIAQNSAEFKANQASLDKLQPMFDQVNAFEGTANKNISMLENLAQKIPDLGARFANVPVRQLSAGVLGTENMAAFKTALAPVQTEAAKILNSTTLSGTLSDSSRHELQDIVDGNLSYKPLVASLHVLQQDFANRHQSYQDQIGFIQQRLKSATAPGSGEGAPAPQTHVFSLSAWQAANPKGDPNAAKAAAQAQGFQVGP